MSHIVVLHKSVLPLAHTDVHLYLYFYIHSLFLLLQHSCTLIFLFMCMFVFYMSVVLFFTYVYVCFFLGIQCGQQRKNFIVQGNFPFLTVHMTINALNL